MTSIATAAQLKPGVVAFSALPGVTARGAPGSHLRAKPWRLDSSSTSSSSSSSRSSALHCTLGGAVLLRGAARLCGLARRGPARRRRATNFVRLAAAARPEANEGDPPASDVQQGRGARERIILVGAGPGGLALAGAVAQALGGVEILVLEGRPAKADTAKSTQPSRSHTIGLGRRAREALIEVGGAQLWENVSSRGMVAGSFTLHLNGVPLALPAPEGEPVVLVDRAEINAALAEHLETVRKAPRTEVRIEHSTKVRSVNLVERCIVVARRRDDGEEEEETLHYDLLVGADGVRSRVREAMGSQLPRGRFESELRLLPGRWQVLHMDLPKSFERQGVHAMVSSDAPFGLFCIPNAKGPHCVIISWSSNEAPSELLDARTPEQLEAVLLRYFPGLERVPPDAAAAFLEAQPSKAVVSRCRPLHDADHATCVIGDAAHAVGGGSLGQGCSAALQDAAALARCLREGAELAKALRLQDTSPGEQREWPEGDQEALVSSLAAFSEQRAAEGWALPDLIELQSAAEMRSSALIQSPLVMAFFIEQLGRGTLKPFADIAARLLKERMQSNQRASQNEVQQFMAHLRLRPTMKFSPAVLFYLLERAVLNAWTFILDALSRLKPPMQTALMATDESYSALVARNSSWLALIRAAKAAAGVTRITDVKEVRGMSRLSEAERRLWAREFSIQERLQDDVLVRQSSAVDTFYAIQAGRCRVLRGGVEVAQLGPGDCFGEAALLLGAPSPITVEAASDVTLLRMPGNIFRDLAERAGPELQQALADPARAYGADLASVAAVQKTGRSRVRSLLEDRGFFQAKGDGGRATLGSTDESARRPATVDAKVDIDDLVDSAGCEMYVKGEVVALGCQRMRVLELGSCSVMRGGREVRSLRPGDFFGPDLAPDERVVARSEEVHVCSFAREATTGLGLLLGERSRSYESA